MPSNRKSGAYKADLNRLITPLFSSELVAFLRSRGWSDQRIAKTIGTHVDFVRRVHVGVHQFTAADLQSLAKAEGLDPLRLLFDALEPAVMKSDLGGLWKMTKHAMDGDVAPVARLRRQPISSRRVRASAA